MMQTNKQTKNLTDHPNLAPCNLQKLIIQISNAVIGYWIKTIRNYPKPT